MYDSYQPNARVVRAARDFIRIICEEYGNDRGMEFWDNLRKNLGEDISSDILFGFLTDAGLTSVKISKVGPNKIQSIKEIRSMSGMTLKDALYFVESISKGAKTLDLRESDTKSIERFIMTMRNLGAEIEQV